ncbi:hypothetical protein C8R45DRAFT_1096806 [Mycena sanguinolenta]|nr:hypothetical protein C8R45DRAFT_1096806 [Mycena sanguinolenta]
MSDTVSPRLPRESECAVFELTALLHPTAIPKLVLVASRVKDWVEPLLYRVVFLSCWDSHRHGFPILSADAFLRKMGWKSPSFLQAAVQYLFLEYSLPASDMATVNSVLASCPGVTHLFIHNQSPASCAARPHFKFTAPLFHNITHLRLRGGVPNLDIHHIWTGLCSMPKLTHGAFDSGTIASLTPALMRENNRLQCIVHISWGDVNEEYQDDLDLFRLTDGADFWALAEFFIAAKLAGKFDRSCYFISEDDLFRT